jgi:hypothetical protein
MSEISPFIYTPNQQLSVLKDSVKRWRSFNHFLDPDTNLGYDPKNDVGSLSEILYKLDIKGPWSNARDFALRKDIQQDWINKYKPTSDPKGYFNNYSYEEAVSLYRDNKKAEAYRAIGHVAHLLQDMGSPPHVRNDGHAINHWLLFLPLSDIPLGVEYEYEYYVSEKLKSSINFTKSDLVNVNNPAELFNRFASYTKRNFFSEDHIEVDDTWFSDHRAKHDIDNFRLYLTGNLVDENNSNYSNLKIKFARLGLFSRWLPTNKALYYILDEEVHKSYWNVLSYKSSQYTASLIDLFQKEVSPVPSCGYVAPRSEIGETSYEFGPSLAYSPVDIWVVGYDNPTAIYFTMVNTYDGSMPADPRVPTSSDNDGSVRDLCLECLTLPNSNTATGKLDIYADVGQYKRMKVRLRAYNCGGPGPVSQVYSFTFNMRDLPSAVSSVIPSSGSWTSNPPAGSNGQIEIRSYLATKIYFTMVNTYDGSTPANPRVPTSGDNDGYIGGDRGPYDYDFDPGTYTQSLNFHAWFNLYGSPGQYKRSKLRFLPYNSVGAGPVSGVYSYTMDLTTINPTIAQGPMSGHPGTTFVQWGTEFTHNGTATLHFQKPDGTEYPTQKINLDGIGHFETSYYAPMDKPLGTYKWWAIDGATGIKSNTVSYVIN